ncbi:DUF5723 family protein [Flammeovirga pacifica]|nr:DUF5723 family protein [Flammeovirga pacifica]
MKKYLYILPFIFLCVNSYAQQVNTLFFQENVAQAQQLNPARSIDSKWVVSIPITNISLSATNEFSLSDIYYEKNGQGYIDQNALSNILSPKNNVQLSSLSSEIIGLYHQTDNFGFRVSLNYGLFQKTVYNDNLFKLLTKGPAAPGVLGETQYVSAIMDVMGYVSLNLGTNFKVNEKLSLGATIKLLSGKQQLKAKAEASFVQKDNTSFDTEVDGRFTLSGNGLGKFIDTDNNFSVNEDDMVESTTSFSNYGAAIDLGAIYQINDQWKVEASVLNLGAIKWSADDQVNYDSDLGNYNFDGLNIQDVLLGNSIESPYPTFDTLSFKEYEGKSTEMTVLPWSFNIGTSYNLTKNTTLGALYSQTNYEELILPSFTLHAQQKLGKVFGIGLSYTADKQSLAHLGGMVSVGFPGFQMYFITDNLITGAFDVEGTKTANMRFGANLNFGSSKKY